MVGLIITLLIAALAYIILAALTGSTILALIAAVLVLVSGIPSGGYGLGGRFGGRGA